MQKKLIAAAVAGLLAVPAMAQTNVTISGALKMGWEHYKLSGGATALGHDAESRVSDQSSQVVFNVVEDLGGGLKAWGQIDSRINSDLGAGAWSSGNTGVGFMGDKWGKFTLGRWDVHYQEMAGIEASRAGSLQTLFGHGMMSQVATVYSAAPAVGTVGSKAGAGAYALATEGLMTMGGRASNLMMWDSPNWNGFTARVGYSTAARGNEGIDNRVMGNAGGGRAWTGTLRYNNGPWQGCLSYWNENGESRVAGARAADSRSTRAWIGYTFAMGLKLGFGYDHSSFDNHILGAAKAVGSGNASRNAWFIPVTYTFGPHAIYAKYARAGHASGSAIAAGTGGDYKAHAWHLGYDYAFSKRTSVGVFYTKVNNNCNAACTVGGAYDQFAVSGTGNAASPTLRGEDSRQWYLGMAHSF